MHFLIGCRMDPMLGRMCKRLIDHCRARYIESHVNALFEKKRMEEGKAFRAELVYYCESEDSPENCLILGQVIDNRV